MTNRLSPPCSYGYNGRQYQPKQHAMTDFSTINKSSSQSFNAQKRLIKDLLAGKTIPCSHCGKPLAASLPAAGETHLLGHIRCPKGCTDIELEVE
ncbi:hypothetical protein [Shewanella sp. FJAT-52076]|uniref:hypothetical protein n=1 Tax=Shewanella sp. FJAT-52076 TaxID=2864202 RepID=UPI0021AC7E43|nr:hypothetical protein [Shewanella sp. FJAT-52076]